MTAAVQYCTHLHLLRAAAASLPPQQAYPSDDEVEAAALRSIEFHAQRSVIPGFQSNHSVASSMMEAALRKFSDMRLTRNTSH